MTKVLAHQKIPKRKRKIFRKSIQKSLSYLVLSAKRNEDQIDIKLCIICQKGTKKAPISKTIGRSKIIEYADIIEMLIMMES